MSALSQCPRCDYDLSGETCRWAEQCPVRGVCPECGLEFAWGEVLNAARRIVPGFVEHERGVWATRWAAWRTWGWVSRPWVFWDRVRVHHRIVLPRALAWIFMIVVPMHLVLASADFVVWTSLASNVSTLLDAVIAAASCLCWPFLELTPHPIAVVAIRVLYDRDRYLFLGIGAMTLAWPLLLLGMPWTRAAAKVHARHVWRAACYSLWWAGVFWILAAIRQVLRLAHTLITPPGTRSGVAWEIFDTFKDFLRDALRVPGAVFATASCWLAIWWFFAISRGFRFRRATWVCVALWFTASLFGITVWFLAHAARYVWR